MALFFVSSEKIFNRGGCRASDPFLQYIPLPSIGQAQASKNCHVVCLLSPRVSTGTIVEKTVRTQVGINHPPSISLDSVTNYTNLHGDS